MKSTNNPNKVIALALNQKAIEGLDKYLAHVKSMTVAGTVYTPAAMKETLQAEVDANAAVDESQAQYKQQVVVAKLARSKGRAMRKVIKTYVLSTFGADDVQTLKGFGISPPKPAGARTAAAKAQSAKDAAATRQARKEALASIDASPPNAPPPAPAGSRPPKS